MNKLKKILTLALIILTTFIPTVANAEWKQNNIGWWYTEGNSWATGWRQIDGKWYYFDTSGYMKTGWQEIDGYYYYFYKDGSMAQNAKIDGFILDSDGKWISSHDYNLKVKVAENAAIDRATGTIDDSDTGNIVNKYYEEDLIY